LNTIKRKKRLIDELKDKEYRDSYVSSSVDVGIAFQIRALRKQRDLTQNQFADIIGIKQERVSALENPDKTPNVSTLKKIASALEIGLSVKFVPISDLVKWDLNLSSDSLEVSSFEHDPYFKEIGKNNEVATDRKQYTALPTPEVSGNLIRVNFQDRENLSSQQKINPPVTGSASSIAISI